MPVYQFVCHDRVRDCDVWRYRSPVSLWVEWLAARLGYRAWLYVQVSSGDMITRDMLSWRDEIEVP